MRYLIRCSSTAHVLYHHNWGKYRPFQKRQKCSFTFFLYFSSYFYLILIYLSTQSPYTEIFFYTYFIHSDNFLSNVFKCLFYYSWQIFDVPHGPWVVCKFKCVKCFWTDPISYNTPAKMLFLWVSKPQVSWFSTCSIFCISEPLVNYQCSLTAASTVKFSNRTLFVKCSFVTVQ